MENRLKSKTVGQCRSLRLLVVGLLAIAVASAAVADGDLSDGDLSYVCSGNEPFWRLEISPTAALLTRPGIDGIKEQVFNGRLDSFGYLNPGWSVWRGKAARDSGGLLVVVAREETCLDTMADDAVFDHRAIVSFPEGNAATGCCNAVTALDPAGAPPVDPGAGPADDWARLWPDLKPAIDACLADGGTDAGSTVVKAWPMNHGRIGVRLGGADGARFDCIVIAGANTVERIEPVAEGAPTLPGERAPVFLPSQNVPPRVTCGRLGRVVDYRGATAGYLHYRDGCPHP